MIRLASPDDVGRLAVTATRAFAEDPVMRWLYPDDTEYEASAPSAFHYVASRCLYYGSAWCTDDAVATALWFPPGRPEIPDGAVERTGGEISEELMAKFQLLRDAMDIHTPSEDHWYLHVLATHPDWQRQGLGGALMNAVFVDSDAAGIPAYLETERPELVAYYRHHGFEVRSEWDVGDDGPHMWGMLRPPQPT